MHVGRMPEHINAELAIFKILNQSKEFTLVSKAGTKKIPISKIIWEEAKIGDTSMRADMLILDNNGKKYFLEIVNTNPISSKKIQIYKTGLNGVGIYITIQNLIFGVSLKKQEKIISDYIRRNGFLLIE